MYYYVSFNALQILVDFNTLIIAPFCCLPSPNMPLGLFWQTSLKSCSHLSWESLCPLSADQSIRWFQSLVHHETVHTACQPCCCACYSHKSLHCVGAFNKPWYLRACFQWGTNSFQVSTNIFLPFIHAVLIFICVFTSHSRSHSMYEK